MEKISVIIPVYNHAKEVQKAVSSLRAQTFKDFEIIAVDDGSTDETKPVLARLAVRVINIPHSGAGAARNAGAREAKGEYLLFLDADAEMAPEALEKFLAALESNPGAAFAYSSFCFGWKKFGNLAWDAGRLKKENFIHTTSLIRKEKFPGFDESLRRFQDWDLWLTITDRGGKGVWIPDTLFKIAPRKSGGMSKWLPKFAYNLPWLKAVKEYKAAADIIKKKHKI